MNRSQPNKPPPIIPATNSDATVREIVPPDHGPCLEGTVGRIERKLGLPSTETVRLFPKKEGRTSWNREVVRTTVKAEVMRSLSERVVAYDRRVLAIPPKLQVTA